MTSRQRRERQQLHHSFKLILTGSIMGALISAALFLPLIAN